MTESKLRFWNFMTNLPEYYVIINCFVTFSVEDDIHTSFSIGEDEDEGGECSTAESKTTQTDLLLKQLLPLKRLPSQQPPRPLEECVRILRSDVSDVLNCHQIISNDLKN